MVTIAQGIVVVVKKTLDEYELAKCVHAKRK